MQFPGNAPALFILRGDQAHREAAQLNVQRLQLLRLAVKFGKYADFGAQQFRN